MHSLSFDEKNILLRIANGDESAFRLLFDKYHPKIYSLSMHITRSQTVAEDMVQEVFSKLWEKRKGLHEIEYINAWLRTIARNVCCDYLRRLAIERLAIGQLIVSKNEDALSPEVDFIDKEKRNLIEEAISALCPQQQKVYLLSNRYGMKQKDIALQLNISVHTVKEYKKLALRFIRRYVQKRVDIAIAIFLLSQV
jgi:RNA polymerase sigma-70 factor (family 1)